MADIFDQLAAEGKQQPAPAAGSDIFDQLAAETPPPGAPGPPKAPIPQGLAGPQEPWWMQQLPAVGGIVGGTVGSLTDAFTGPLGTIGGATLGGAAGSALEQHLNRGVVDPFQTGAEAVSQGVQETGGLAITKALGLALRGLKPARLMQSALGQVGPDAEKAATAALEHRIPLDAGATEAVKAKIGELGNDIKTAIAAGPPDIPASQYVAGVQDRFDKLRAKWSRDPDEGAAFLNQIDNVEKNFLLNHGNVQPIVSQGRVPLLNAAGQPIVNASGHTLYTTSMVTRLPKDMTLAELRANAQPIAGATAQGVKQQAWNTINATKGASAWDLATHPGIKLETKQAMGGALASDLENVYPELKKLNPKMGEVLALKDALADFAERDARENLKGYLPGVGGGIGAAIGAAAGHVVSPVAGTVAGGALGGTLGEAGSRMLQRALANPAIKSHIAIMLYRASQMPGAGAARAVAREAPAMAIRGGRGLVDLYRTNQDLNQAFGQARGGVVDEIERRALARHATVRALAGD